MISPARSFRRIGIIDDHGDRDTIKLATRLSKRVRPAVSGGHERWGQLRVLPSLESRDRCVMQRDGRTPAAVILPRTSRSAAPIGCLDRCWTRRGSRSRDLGYRGRERGRSVRSDPRRNHGPRYRYRGGRECRKYVATGTCSLASWVMPSRLLMVVRPTETSWTASESDTARRTDPARLARDTKVGTTTA